MTPLIETALWQSAQEDYVKALGIAGLALEKVGIKEPSVVQAGAATVLIHVTKLRDQHIKQERDLSQVPTALRHDDGPALPVVPAIPPCPKCGGGMKKNDNRKTEKSPHFLCLQERGQCGKPGDKGGFFVTGAWQK